MRLAFALAMAALGAWLTLWPVGWFRLTERTRTHPQPAVLRKTRLRGIVFLLGGLALLVLGLVR